MTELATIHAKPRRPTARHPRRLHRDRPPSPSLGFGPRARCSDPNLPLANPPRLTCNINHGSCTPPRRKFRHEAEISADHRQVGAVSPRRSGPVAGPLALLVPVIAPLSPSTPLMSEGRAKIFDRPLSRAAPPRGACDSKRAAGNVPASMNARSYSGARARVAPRLGIRGKSRVLSPGNTPLAEDATTA